MVHRSIRFQYASLQPFANQPQKGFVVDPLLQQLDQFLMRDFVEEASDVRLDQVVITATSQRRAQVPDRI